MEPGVAENILIYRQFKNQDGQEYKGFYKPSLFQQRVLDFQDKFYMNRQQALRELYAALDRDIAQKPFKMMANVVVQAVLVDDYDIDSALADYHEFLVKKYKRLGKEKEIEKTRIEAIRQRNLLQ